jgi:hypothetical protein
MQVQTERVSARSAFRNGARIPYLGKTCDCVVPGSSCYYTLFVVLNRRDWLSVMIVQWLLASFQAR